MSPESFVQGCLAALILTCASLLATPQAHAATLGITYTLSGTPNITGITPTTLSLSGVNTGSFDQASLAANALWNPVSFAYTSQASLATGLLTGNFTLTLANGELLSGIVQEDLSTILASPTLTGSYPQTLTFTSGTGEFAGVSGTASGSGSIGLTGGSVSGAGTLSIPTAAAPEPASLELLATGLTLLTLRYRKHP